MDSLDVFETTFGDTDGHQNEETDKEYNHLANAVINDENDCKRQKPSNEEMIDNCVQNDDNNEEKEDKSQQLIAKSISHESEGRLHEPICRPDSPLLPKKERKKYVSRSRSRSQTRRRVRSRSRSRSHSKSRSRSRSRDRSRSPYFGPIIKDYRRGRRGFVRYPRGFRDRGIRSLRRGGHHSQYSPYSSSRRHDFSRSRSRSYSPKRRHIEVDKSENNSEDEKALDPKNLETMRPSDINLSEKRLTQTFLAMLEEKQNKSKMIPMETNRSDTFDAEDNFNRQHGFVNTFNSIREIDSRKHTLSYDLEREGWQVVDDANSESGHKRRYKPKDDYKYEDKQKDFGHKEAIKSEATIQKTIDVEFSSIDDKNKRKKSKKRKKRKKRKTSTSSDSSDSESDNENEKEMEENDKKKSKKRKKSKKKKKKVSTSSSSSENEEKQKKKIKKKDSDLSSDSESEDKPEDNTVLKVVTDSNELVDIKKTPSVTNEVIKSKDKKKKKRKSKVSDSSDSDSDESKKKRKRSKKKRSKKRRQRSSSSSSSSDSSESSESGDRRKKKRKSKKKKQKKHKKDKKKEKTKVSDDKKRIKTEDDSEFMTVWSVGETPLELKWPKKLIRFTNSLPPIQYSINPKVTVNEDDFRQTEDIVRDNELVFESDNQTLATEYERFIDELNPNPEPLGVREDSRALETKLREKLVKQLSDKNEDSMTSSERRAIEKMKKQSHHSFDGNDGNRTHDSLRSAPLSAYYSAKVQKSSPNRKSNESDVCDKKSSKLNENESPMKTNEISLTIGDRKSEHKSETQNIQTSKSDDKKRTTARELLERVKQRKGSNKDTDNRDKDDSHSSKRMPQIGKMKIPAKKCLSRTRTPSVTTANADSTQNTYVSQPMELDLNYDYTWYYKYYMNSVYGAAQHPVVNDPSLAAAYYAHYSMLTSYDYNTTDMTNWMSQRGYALDNNSVATDNQLIETNSEEVVNKDIDKSQELQTFVESTAPERVEDIVEKGLNNESISDLKDSEPINEQKIPVLVSTFHSDVPFDELNASLSPISGSKLKHKVKVRVTTNQDVESADGINSSPPLPPPPARPLMTTFTSSEPITLPNGQVLPVGTKQTVVHPYQTNDSNKLTAEWFCNAFNAQNTTQTNS